MPPISSEDDIKVKNIYPERNKSVGGMQPAAVYDKNDDGNNGPHPCQNMSNMDVAGSVDSTIPNKYIKSKVFLSQLYALHPKTTAMYFCAYILN